MTVANESAADSSIPAVTSIKNESKKHDANYQDVDAAPLHFHAMRIPARLQGLPSSQHNIRRSRSSSRSRSKPTSRDGSPSGASRTSTDSLSGSVVDSDILLDRLGLEELEPPLPHEIDSQPPLPCVNERMSEESLDDCHAFSDLAVPSVKVERSSSFTSSRDGGGSVQGDSSFLETLEEFDEEEEDDDEDGANDNGSKKKQQKKAERLRLLKWQERQKNGAKLESEVLQVMPESDEKLSQIKEK